MFEQREEYSYDSNFLDKALNFVDDLTLGILGTYSNALNTIMNGKSEEKEWIDEYFSLIDLERIHKEVVNSSTNLIELIKTDLINDFVQPIIQKTEEIIANKDDIENRIKELEIKLEGLNTNLSIHKTQVEQMKIIESTI